MMAGSDLTLRPATIEDLPALLAISNAVNWDAPPWTVERAVQWQQQQAERAGFEQWAAERGGEIVGELLLWEMWGIAQPGTWQVILEVADEAAGQGIGSALFALLLERARALGARRLLSEVREDRPESMAFAEKRGFRPTGNVDRFARLDLAEARLPDAQPAEAALAQSGIRIATLAELGTGDERLLHALHRLYEDARRDIPHEGGFVERSFEDWRLQSLESPDTAPDRFWLALDGERPVGLTRLTERPGDTMYHAFLGVDRAYRGRGIGLALKLRAIRWAREHGIRYLYTSNDAANTRMLAINAALGYIQLPATIEVERLLTPWRC